MARFLWPASLTETTSFWLNERSCLKAVSKSDGYRGRQPVPYSGLHIHIHANTHLYTHVCLPHTTHMHKAERGNDILTYLIYIQILPL